MAEFLLLLVLAGLHASAATSNAKQYRGPVIYTNLPPPVLYFPRFPERPRLSNRGDQAPAEDPKRGSAAEYVPYPHKDLPLLVYQSESQPPVHVVQPPAKKEGSTGYQTGPAVYREEVGSGGQYDGEGPGPQASASTNSEKYINVGLSTSQGPPVDPSNPQYISIGLTALQGEGQRVQYSGSSAQQQQYAQYVPQGSESPAYVYYSPSQYSEQGQQQTQIPVEQLTQVIQSYLAQQQQAAAQHQATYVPYPDATYPSPSTSEPAQAQHVGITIIRQPTDSSTEEARYHHQQQESSVPSYGGESESQKQVLSIGVYPIAANDYGGATDATQQQQQQQQYYQVLAPVNSNPYADEEYRNSKHQQFPTHSDDYRTTRQPYHNDDYRGTGEPYQSPDEDYRQPPTLSSPYQGSASDDYRNTRQPQYGEDYRQPSGSDGPAGYQIISIDLSALRNQQQQQKSGPMAAYQPPPERPVDPPSQNYRHPGDSSYSGGGQQILIQIPHKILSDPEKGRGEIPYTGTAQVANVVHVPAGGYSGNGAQAYGSRPVPPARHPKAVMPQQPTGGGGLLSGGINIAIIKQTEPNNPSPIFKSPSEKQPEYQRPTAPAVHPRPRVPPVPQRPRPRQPAFAPPSRHPPPPSRVHPPAPPRTHHPPRFNPQPAPFRNPATRTARIPSAAAHPGIFASSNLHFTTASPDGGTVTPVIGNALPTTKFETQPQALPLRNPFSEVSFDEIDAFLNPNFDLFGSMTTNGPDKKKVEEETRFLQKVAGELLSQEMSAVANLQPAFAKPPPNLLTVPLPYKYWEQPRSPPPVRHLGMPDERTRLTQFYSHLQQHPHNVRGNKPFKGGRKRGLGKGYLKRKLSALRSSIRGGKSRISPRLGEDGVPEVASLLTGAVIKTERPGLDGVSIPLHQVLSSRISTEEEEEVVRKSEPLPPIIIYKGFKEPVEVYGEREDIEKVANGNDKGSPQDAKVVAAFNTSTESSTAESSSEGPEAYTTIKTPELRDRRREDSDKWLPIEYALAEDTYDRNDTSSLKTESAKEPFSGSVVEASIKKNLQELFSLLGNAERATAMSEEER